MVKRKTVAKRLSRAVHNIAQWCRTNRHRPLSEQQAILSQKLRGHYAYYGIPGNAKALREFLWLVRRVWRKWLDRRNHRRNLYWDRFYKLMKRYPLPEPKTTHSDRRASEPMP